MKMSRPIKVYDLKPICTELYRNVQSVEDEAEKEKIVLNHAKTYADSEVKVYDFPRDLAWFNVSKSLSLREELLGKIVILDFFTYSCIKCLHVLEYLKALEEIYSIEDGLVVVGVHRAKFYGMQDRSKTLKAVQRYKVSIRKVCLVSGKVSFVCGSDDHSESLRNCGDRDGKARWSDVQYPLGVAWNPIDQKIYIADTYNHKIKKTDAEGNCATVCGVGKPSENHVFDEPNGLTVRQDGEMLYVADTYNHCIKSIYLRDVQKIKVISIDIPVEAQHRQEEDAGEKIS